MLKRSDKLPSSKPCPFCGSKARIRDLYDVVDWTDDDEPITERRFVCECAGIECWVSPITDSFDTEEEAIEAWNRRSEVLERESKSEWQKDHEILKAYSDGANGVLDELKDEIEKYWSYCDENLQAPTLSGIKQLIDKYKTESEEEE